MTYEKCNTISNGYSSGHYKFGWDMVLKQEYVAIYGGDENTRRGQITVYQGLPKTSPFA